MGKQLPARPARPHDRRAVAAADRHERQRRRARDLPRRRRARRDRRVVRLRRQDVVQLRLPGRPRREDLYGAGALGERRGERPDVAVRAVRRVQEALPRHRSRAGLLEGSDRARRAASRTSRGRASSSRSTRTTTSRAAPGRTTSTARGRASASILFTAPGFYFAPEIPRAVAAPLTLVAFGARQLRRVLDRRAHRARAAQAPDDRDAPSRRTHSRPRPPRHARARRPRRVQRVLLLRRPADAAEAAALGRHRLGPRRRVRVDGDLHAPRRPPRGPVRPGEVRAEDPQEVGVGRRATVRRPEGHLPAPHRAHQAARGPAARVQGDGARDGRPTASSRAASSRSSTACARSSASATRTTRRSSASSRPRSGSCSIRRTRARSSSGSRSSSTARTSSGSSSRRRARAPHRRPRRSLALRTERGVDATEESAQLAADPRARRTDRRDLRRRARRDDAPHRRRRVGALRRRGR